MWLEEQVSVLPPRHFVLVAVDTAALLLAIEGGIEGAGLFPVKVMALPMAVVMYAHTHEYIHTMANTHIYTECRQIKVG
jgi:hypothetical protein